MQNGVDHSERFRAASHRDAMPAAVYVAVSMSGPGRVKHNGRGDLVIGDAPAVQLQFTASTFERAQIPCRISDNIQGELYVKLIMNCAYNAQSALTQSNYGSIVALPETRKIVVETVEECIAVAKAAGIQLPPPNPLQAALDLGTTTMPQQHSSTAQDIARGKLTEIDSLNGYVVRTGAKFGVPTPINKALHALTKLRETARSS